MLFGVHLFAYYVSMYQRVHVDVGTYIENKTPSEDIVPDGVYRWLRTSIYKGVVDVEARVRYLDCGNDH